MVTVPSQLLTSTLKMLKGGGLTIKSKDANLLEVKIDEKEIAIDIQNLETIKDFITPLRKKSLSSEEKEKQSIYEILKSIKDFSKELKNEKMTINIKDTGESILIIGDKAKPRISRLILGSNIQANVLKIISMIRKLR
jgi:hypothetical protein